MWQIRYPTSSVCKLLASQLFSSRSPAFFFRSSHLLKFNPLKMGGPSRAEEVPEWVDRLVAKHKVTVFSKTYCPYCKKAIAALETLKLDDLVGKPETENQTLPVAAEHVEQIEKNEYCDAIQDYLLKKTGARSVPRVFVKGQFFGGGDDTVAGINGGEFQRRLEA